MATKPSVTGNASHTPVVPKNDESKNTMGTTKKSPLVKEIICAGTGLAVEVKNMAMIILKPAKKMAVK